MPFGTATTILALALLSGLTTVAGTALAIWLGKDIRAITTGIGFSAGLMLLISIHELIPQSLRATGACTPGLRLPQEQRSSACFMSSFRTAIWLKSEGRSRLSASRPPTW